MSGARDPFLPRLLDTIHRAKEIDFATSFINSSGLALLSIPRSSTWQKDAFSRWVREGLRQASFG